MKKRTNHGHDDADEMEQGEAGHHYQHNDRVDRSEPDHDREEVYLGNNTSAQDAGGWARVLQVGVVG